VTRSRGVDSRSVGSAAGFADSTLLVLRDVHRSFGGLRAVDGASLDVKAGSITALIGPNGAGKTTLFNIITGFERVDGGQIVFDGQPIAGKPPHITARLGMIRTFQMTKTLAAMPVIENMLLAAPEQPGEHLCNLVIRRRQCRRREAVIRERACELLDSFGLLAKSNEYAGTLSGGQCKLLELARALMAEPRLVLLDEPMAGINPTLGRTLLAHMHQLRATGTTFLFIEHDMDVVMGQADRVIVMALGKVIADGTPDMVRSDAQVIDAYLGGKT